MQNDLNHKVGVHEGLITSIQGDLTEMKADIKLLLASVNQSKGGWKAVIIISGIAGSCGAAMSKLISVLWYLPR